MKRNFLPLIFLTFFVLSCNKNSKNDTVTNHHSDTIATSNKEEKVESKESFNIESIPVSKQLTGSFPYFKMPENYVFRDPNHYNGDGQIKDIDREYFYVNGKYVMQEGKTFKADIRAEDSKKYNVLELQKSFDDLISKLGGVKVNNGETLKEGEEESLAKSDPNAYTNGYLHSSNNWKDVHTYVIRTPENVLWIQCNYGSESAYLTVLQVSEFVNKMSILPASEIKNQLDKNGKAVLHINFDTDKASLSSEGKSAVAEIKKVLDQNPTMKVSINGYTDNSGNKSHNLKLSDDRAKTVKTELENSGISSQRLISKGFGQENPIADNGNEKGKSENRRVEIVKI